MFRKNFFLLFLSGFWWVFGCGNPNAPVLSQLKYLGQSQQSPMVLLFAVDFADPNGDLGEGST